MSRIKPAEVRYYIDADMLGLAQVLARLRPDVTYPGDPGGVVHGRQRPPCPVTSPHTPDPEWLHEVTGLGLLVITRDRHIQTRPAELAAVRDTGARMVALAGPEAKGTFEQLEVVMCQWRRIEALHVQSGPFIYAITRTGMVRILLELT